jgi:hypothetical protein
MDDDVVGNVRNGLCCETGREGEEESKSQRICEELGSLFRAAKESSIYTKYRSRVVKLKSDGVDWRN